MKRALLLFSLLLPALLLSATTWKGEKGGGFSITLTLSDEQVTIPDKLTLRAEFTHPQDYTVDLDTLRMNLLKYAGLSEPPFALNEEKDLFPEAGKTLVTFSLEPQLEGLFFISLYDIPFTATDKSLPPVTIVSDIFKVQVSLPPAPAFAKDYAYPLLSLSNRFPVQMDPSNRLELLENREFLAEHALQNRAVLARRTPPWPQVAGALLFFFLLLIARLQPKRTLEIGRAHV